jgi:hypothetical protein
VATTDKGDLRRSRGEATRVLVRWDSRMPPRWACRRTHDRATADRVEEESIAHSDRRRVDGERVSAMLQVLDAGGERSSA